jgi:phosphoribosylformylglycinamidine cyclo-ligase
LNALGGLIDSGLVKGLAHITGGGLIENIPRILPAGTAVEIRRDRWTAPPIFGLLARIGNVPENEMLRTFNMGIGMVVITDHHSADQVRAHLNALDEKHYDIGSVVEGNGQVTVV